MRFNRFFSKRKVFTYTYAVFAIVCLVIIAMIVNALHNFSFDTILQTHAKKQEIPVSETIVSHPLLFLFFMGAFIVGYFVFAYKVRVSFGNLNIGQKGTSRWTTREELDEQFIKIYEKETSFSGMGGIPIARDGDKLYIDNTNVNNLIIGGTRSGKGQTTNEPIA